MINIAHVYTTILASSGYSKLKRKEFLEFQLSSTIAINFTLKWKWRKFIPKIKQIIFKADTGYSQKIKDLKI